MNLEHELAVLAEHWHWSPTEILRLPCRRRRRLLRWKERHGKLLEDNSKARGGDGRKSFDQEDLEYIWAEPPI